MVSRTWCFTVNNYSEDDRSSLLQLPYSYLIIGDELGDSGTPHLQGYVTLQKSVRLSFLKKINSRAHWEIAKKASAAAQYCKKEGNFREYRPSDSENSGQPRKLKLKKLKPPPPPEIDPDVMLNLLSLLDAPQIRLQHLYS